MHPAAGRALGAVSLAALWAVTKAFSIWAYVLGPDEYSDTYYYFQQTQRAREAGGALATIFPEYPTPAAWLLMLPSWFGADTYQSYRLGFLVLVTVFDAVFVAVLIARTNAIAVVGWLLLSTMSGLLALLRFDLIPAVLAAAALLLLVQRRPAWAASVIAVATAVKVWPLLLFPLTLGQRGRRLAPTVGLAAVGAALALASVASAGWARLFSPLSFQSDRGLQVEAVAATPAMVARLTDDRYRIYYSDYNAFEVAGPSVDRLLGATDVAVWIGLAVLVALLVHWYRRGCPAEAAGYLALFAILTMIVTSKALSPQYMLWIAAPTAVLLGVAWQEPAGARPLRATALLIVVLALLYLTGLIYPLNYDDWLFRNEAGPLKIVVARNAVLVALTVWMAWCAARLPTGPPTRREPVSRGASSERSRPSSPGP